VIETAALHEVFDLTDPDANVLFGMSLEDARDRVRSGNLAAAASGARMRAASLVAGPITPLISKTTACGF